MRVEITRLSVGEGDGSAFESRTVLPGGSECIGLSRKGAELIVCCNPNGGSIQIKSPGEKIVAFKFNNLSDRKGKEIHASQGEIEIKGRQGLLVSTGGEDVAIYLKR